MLARRLYKKRKDNILRPCIERNESDVYVEQAYIALGNIHISLDRTKRRIQHMGVYWPTMHKDAHAKVRSCTHCKRKPPVPHATLYHVMVAPNWSKYMVQFLTTRTFPKGATRARCRAVEAKAKNFMLIANQLYKRGIDKQLRLCITEVETYHVLQHAHVT